MNLAAMTGLLRPLNLWSAIGLPAPQSLIEVQFRGYRAERDVSANHVILSLAPLWIGVDAGAAPASRAGRAELSFRDRATGAELGLLQLVEDGGMRAADSAMSCFRVRKSIDHCLPAPMRLWQSWLQLRHRDTGSPFRMTQAALRHLAVFYICPRPVALISVEDGEHSNLFPMDLIGPLDGGLFVLALRGSSASVPAMVNTRRVALADMPMTGRSLAYALGKHHRGTAMDWNALPCAVERSPRFGLRVPTCAARVRDCEIIAHELRGSHMVFLCRVISDEARSQVPRLFHTSGIHHAWRRQRGVVPWQDPPA
jgi:flavin reductase (DIM6/NTAB) family NADH-FMN oxidoreductase RutF